MIWEGCRTHRRVTGSMKLKKKQDFFSENRAPGVFGAPGCIAVTLFDLVNNGIGSRDSAKTICVVSGGYRTHRCVAGPMKFKKLGRFFRINVLP